MHVQEHTPREPRLDPAQARAYERRIRELEREVRRLNASAGATSSGNRGPRLTSDPDTGKYRSSDQDRDRKKFVGLAAASESEESELEDYLQRVVHHDVDPERSTGTWTRAPGFTGLASIADIFPVVLHPDDSTDSVPELVSSTDTSFDQGAPPFGSRN